MRVSAGSRTFVGDSAGHCIPATAEGIRTAFYFGLSCGRELRAVLEGRSSHVEAAARYRSFCEERRRVFDALLNGLALQALTSEAALDRERIRDEVIRTLLGEVAAAGAAQAVAR